MAKYSIYLTAEASQVIEVEADTFDEAVEFAFEQHDLYENISMKFDLGDPQLLREGCLVDGQPIPDE